MAPINGYKQCKNGSLIQARYWSDGIVDCTDGSDERASSTTSQTPALGESVEEKINQKFNSLVRELEAKQNQENHFADLSQAIIEALEMSSSKSSEGEMTWGDWALKVLDILADYALPNIIALCISGGTARRLNKKFATQKDARKDAQKDAQKDANKVGEDTLHQHQDEKGEDKATVNLLG